MAWYSKSVDYCCTFSCPDAYSLSRATINTVKVSTRRKEFHHDRWPRLSGRGGERSPANQVRGHVLGVFSAFRRTGEEGCSYIVAGTRGKVEALKWNAA